AEDRGALRRLVEAKSLEDARAVVDDVAHDVHGGVIPGDERAVAPDLRGAAVLGWGVHGGENTGAARRAPARSRRPQGARGVGPHRRGSSGSVRSASLIARTRVESARSAPASL